MGKYLLESTYLYYFDASDAAVADPGGVWTNDADVADGSIATYADSTSPGTATSNYLEIQGTNAPATGGTINSVRVRTYNSDSTSSEPYPLKTSAFFTLTAPTGGWTWTQVQGLEARIFIVNDGSGGDNAKIVVYADGQAETLLTETEVFGVAGASFHRVHYVEVAVTVADSGDDYLLEDGTGYYLTEENDPISVLTDRFTAANTSLWTDATAGGATASYSANGWAVAFPASTTATTIASKTSVYRYDITASSAYLMAPTVPSSATAANGEFRLQIDATNWMRFVTEAGTIYAQHMVAGTRSNVASATYNATTHKWWRIESVGANVQFQTSSDGVSWAQLGGSANITAPIALTNLQVFIAGSAYQAETNPGTFVVKNFNMADGTPPTVTTAAATSVSFASVVGNGNVTSGGSATVTERGFVWSTAVNPTTANSKLVVSGTTGAYSGSITGLTPNTLYHYRAYATNAAGTLYGADTTFTTLTNVRPTIVKNTADGYSTYDPTPTLEFTGTDTDGDDLIYQIQIDSTPQILVQSDVNPGFVNTVNGADMSPFTSGQKISYTVQTPLTPGDYSWRVRAADAYGYSAFTTLSTFTVLPNTAPTVAPNTTDGTVFPTSSTPTLAFTGTDINSDDVAYQLQYNTSATFSSGAVAVENVSAAFSQYATSTTQSYTMPVVTNGALVVPIFNTTTSNITSITYGGVALTKMEAGNSSINLYYLVNPPTGTNNLVITRASVATARSTKIFALSGVNQIVPIGANVQGLSYTNVTAVSTTLNVTANGSLVFEYMSWVDSATAGYSSTIPAGQVVDTSFGASQSPSVFAYATNQSSGVNTYGFNITTQNVSDSYDLSGWVVNPASDATVTDVLSSANAGFSNVGTPGDTSPFTSGQQVSYTVQSALTPATYYWRVRGIDPSGANTWGAWATTRSFTVTSASTSTRSHTTSVYTRAISNKTHVTDTYLRGTSTYSRGNYVSLPTNANDLSTPFTSSDYSNVATDNGIYVAQTGANNLIFEYKYENANSTDPVTITWNGKTTVATSTRTAYLQIWNYNTSAWETLASNSTTSANTDFTLSAIQNTSMSNYYSGGIITARVYQ